MRESYNYFDSLILIISMFEWSATQCVIQVLLLSLIMSMGILNVDVSCFVRLLNTFNYFYLNICALLVSIDSNA